MDEYFEDLTQEGTYYHDKALTYGSVYRLLKEMNISVTGDTNSFEFLGPNGKKYQLGYNNIDEEKYYYFEDGERRGMTDFPGIAFRDLSEILSVEISEQYLLPE